MQTLDPFAFLEAITERPAWHHQAACIGLTDLFFPERGDSSREAKAICAGCPVQAQCRAQGDKERYGIWGGATDYDRRPGRRAQNAKRRAQLARKPVGPRAVKGAASAILPEPPSPAATAQAGGVPRHPLPRLRPSA